ncbi:DsrE/DsrF/TusD sulfur relay family protein [Methanobacterium sp. ACI-7]|uniref:DsrE/DsrF/TusD sulfur relay family protein n=1 Tax=unclassified Methanobacterium TaxID=2627676 RepID=UPI0039C00C2B
MEESASKTLTLILTEGPYRSQHADIAYKIASSALKNNYNVNMFLYMDATHIPRKGQNPHSFPNVLEKIRKLVKNGADIRACVRCATARGYACDAKFPYIKGITITSVYDIPDWIKESDKVISL